MRGHTRQLVLHHRGAVRSAVGLVASPWRTLHCRGALHCLGLQEEEDGGSLMCCAGRETCRA